MKNKIFILLFLIYIIYNIIVFAIYGNDKYRAKKGGWRIPENRLMGMAFFFGGPGGFLGMQIFRHKTKHLQFEILVPAFMVLQALMWVIAAKIILY